MKILHITSHLNIGGVSSSVLSLSQGLVERGEHVVIASGGGQLEARASAMGLIPWRVPLHTSVEFSPQVFAAARTLVARLRQEPVDILHGHTRTAQVVAAYLARCLRLPYVTTWHGFFRPNLGRTIWPCTGDATVAISAPVGTHLQETFHVPPQRIHLIPHGIDTRPFESPVDPSMQARLRDQLRLTRDGPVVGTVARLVASKGVDQLIRSLPGIRASVPDAQLVIVGDGDERASLERVAAEHGVADAVHFSGALPETRVVLSLMDVFVFLPADQEGFGLSLLEAMASARPIVAVRRGGGAPWVLEETGVGALVEPGDLAGLASAVTDRLHHHETARREGQKARAVVKTRYTHARMIDQVQTVYRGLVEESK